MEIHVFILEVYGLQSAKTNLNVEEVFFSIAKDIKQRLAESDSKTEVQLLLAHFMVTIFFLFTKMQT